MPASGLRTDEVLAPTGSNRLRRAHRSSREVSSCVLPCRSVLRHAQHTRSSCLRDVSLRLQEKRLSLEPTRGRTARIRLMSSNSNVIRRRIMVNYELLPGSRFYARLLKRKRSLLLCHFPLHCSMERVTSAFVHSISLAKDERH